MNKFVTCPPEKASDAIELIGKEWMLIGCADEKNGANAMTASWGCLGTLWNKPVCICFIRPQRYTFGLAESSERMSLSFFGDEKREALKYCGKYSGRDGDKLKECGLTYSMKDSVPVFDDARMTLIVRKLYADMLKEDSFLLPDELRHYAAKDYHKFYICEIEKCIVRE